MISDLEREQRQARDRAEVWRVALVYGIGVGIFAIACLVAGYTWGGPQ